jgi:hypothetical protein
MNTSGSVTTASTRSLSTTIWQSRPSSFNLHDGYVWATQRKRACNLHIKAINKVDNNTSFIHIQLCFQTSNAILPTKALVACTQNPGTHNLKNAPVQNPCSLFEALSLRCNVLAINQFEAVVD